MIIFHQFSAGLAKPQGIGAQRCTYDWYWNSSCLWHFERKCMCSHNEGDYAENWQIFVYTCCSFVKSYVTFWVPFV